ncbi:MAG TPA: serine hydrolase domain-containing protein [Acidimicrobiales bacterium]|nr:serine hydrolase domain-containing protein [Acidimicrobiales bacterium]
MGAFDKAGLVRLEEVMAGHAERGEVPGLAWAVARGGEVHAGSAGTTGAGGSAVGRDTIFRISSMTKPVTAVAVLALAEECLIRLDEPVDRLLPELAGRQVMRHPEGALDDTEPARRPITVADLLTFRMGTGMDFGAFGRQPLLDAMAALGVGAGPPAPAAAPAPDEFLRRLGTLPLQHHPGERWLYHTGADVLGVLVARAAGRPLGEVLRERVLEPLGMRDTGFFVPAAGLERFGPAHGTDPATGARTVYDPIIGQWARPPAFEGGGAGLVSTLDDYLAFACMLLAGGTWNGRRVLSRPSVEAMTTNQLTPEQVAANPPTLSGADGWGFGVGVRLRRTGPARSVGSYGWDGGLGTSWANDPAEGLAAVLLTNQMWSSPAPPPVCQDFWTCAYAALE